MEISLIDTKLPFTYLFFPLNRTHVWQTYEQSIHMHVEPKVIYIRGYGYIFYLTGTFPP